VAGGNMCLYFWTDFVGSLKDSKGTSVLKSCKNYQMISPFLCYRSKKG
jgi:hypothetical protein